MRLGYVRHMENPFFTPLDQSLFESRIVQISGSVGSQLAHLVNKQILSMAAADSKKPIYLFINSPGGEVTSGFSIYDTARFVEPEIYTVAVGLAASMGSLMALAAPPECRFAFPNAKFLIHQPLIGGVIQGSASDIAIHAKDIVATRDKINHLYAAETGRSFEEVQEATDRDNWMDVEEAKEFGLISKVIRSISELPGA